MNHSFNSTPASAGAYTFTVEQDSDPSNPREWDNAATLWCWHNRHSLGDTSSRPADALSKGALEEYLRDRGEVALVLKPLYLYDHGEITISSTPFGCIWDSGQVGWAFVTDAAATRAGLAGDAVWAERQIEAEVLDYDCYLRGDVYGYRIYDECGIEVESCWGFHNRDCAVNEARALCLQLTESLVAQQRAMRLRRLKTLLRHRVPLHLRTQLLAA